MTSTSRGTIGGGLPSATVIVATYRRPDFVAELLAALAVQDHPDFDVIVVDDGSPPDDRARVAEACGSHARVTLLQTENRGPAAARNHAARHAGGDWLVFTDDDCIPQQGWLSGLVGAGDRADASVVQGRTITDPTADQTSLGWFARGKTVAAWSGRFQMCNLAVSADAFREVGGLDERFPPHGFGEDTDLGLRMVAAGHRTAFAPDAEVWHRLLPMTYPQFLRRRARWAQVIRVAAISPDGRSTFPHRYVAQRMHVFFWAAVLATAVSSLLGWWPVPVVVVAGYCAHRVYKTRGQTWPLWARALRAPLEFVGVGVESVAFVVGSIRFRTLLV